jgi:hypothetical protein
MPQISAVLVMNALVRPFFASVVSYLQGTSFLALVGHTLLFIVWAGIGVVAYDSYKTVSSGRSLLEATLPRMVISGIHIDSYMKTQKEIGDLLADLRQKTGASRAVLVLFTNGKASVGGVPYIHASAYAESHDARLKPSLPEMQDLDISFIPELHLTLAGETFLYHPADTPDSIRPICQCDTILRGPIIRTFNGKPHGYIFLSWDGDAPAAEPPLNRVQQWINEFSFIFAGVLSTVDMDRLIDEAGADRR